MISGRCSGSKALNFLTAFIFAVLALMDVGYGNGLTTTRRCFILFVMAVFISSSVGGSIRFAVFSSTDRSGSVPLLVTHGCSFTALAPDLTSSLGLG